MRVCVWFELYVLTVSMYNVHFYASYNKCIECSEYTPMLAAQAHTKSQNQLHEQ